MKKFIVIALIFVMLIALTACTDASILPSKLEVYNEVLDNFIKDYPGYATSYKYKGNNIYVYFQDEQVDELETYLIATGKSDLVDTYIGSACEGITRALTITILEAQKDILPDNIHYVIVTTGGREIYEYTKEIGSVKYYG